MLGNSNLGQTDKTKEMSRPVNINNQGQNLGNVLGIGDLGQTDKTKVLT